MRLRVEADAGTKEIKYASLKLGEKKGRGEMCRLRNRCVRIGDSTYLSGAHVCGKSES